MKYKFGLFISLLFVSSIFSETESKRSYNEQEQATFKVGQRGCMFTNFRTLWFSARKFMNGTIRIQNISKEPLFLQLKAHTNVTLDSIELAPRVGKSVEFNDSDYFIVGCVKDQKTGKLVPFPEGHDSLQSLLWISFCKVNNAARIKGPRLTFN